MAGAHLRKKPRRGRRLLASTMGSLVVGLTLGAAATTAVSDDTATRVTSIDAGPAIESPPAAQAARGVARATPEPGPITIAFVGDIYAELSLADRLAGTPDDFVGPFAPVLREADLSIGNLEAAIATGGAPLEKEFTFRAPPTILDALRSGGIDVVSVANNHGVDHGPAGLDETIAAKRAQPDGMLIGVGGDEDEAFAPYTSVVGGHRVAVIAATQVIDGEYISAWTATDDTPGLASAKRVDRLVEEVEAARGTADTVIVFLHWGTEAEVCPNSSQRELARALVDAGADLIVGSHAHRVQGAGRLGDAFVGYGLGNFLFGAVSEESARSGVLLVEVAGREVLGYEWRPGRIEDRVPRPLDGDDAAAEVAAWDELRACTGLTP